MSIFGNKTEVVAEELKGNPDTTEDGQVKRKRGRPKGSKNKPKDPSTGKPIDTPTDKVGFVYIPDPNGIAAAGKLFSFTWMLLGPLVKVTPLSKEEELHAGEALDPVLQKYLPIYQDWKYEINLALIVIGLYQIHHKEYQESTNGNSSESKAEVVE